MAQESQFSFKIDSIDKTNFIWAPFFQLNFQPDPPPPPQKKTPPASPFKNATKRSLSTSTAPSRLLVDGSFRTVFAKPCWTSPKTSRWRFAPVGPSIILKESSLTSPKKPRMKKPNAADGACSPKTGEPATNTIHAKKITNFSLKCLGPLTASPKKPWKLLLKTNMHGTASLSFAITPSLSASRIGSTF